MFLPLLFLEVVKWKCRNCGYVHEGTEAPKKCSACGFPQSYYELLAENSEKPNKLGNY